MALYSHLWTNIRPAGPPTSTHLDHVEATLKDSVVTGRIGLDAGSGSGQDTLAMASRNPSIEVISLDVSEGVYETRWRTAELHNVHVVRASVLSIPLQSGICDFAYSFGVLHHTVDPRQGLGEIVRILKEGGRTFLYLYEDHADNPWKAIPLRLVTALRRITTRLPPKLLSALCFLLSPLIVLSFSLPARLLQSIKWTKALAGSIPFNFGTTLFSVHSDLVDRFGAPIEVRYNQKALAALLSSCLLDDIAMARIRLSAGWVARGIKRRTGR
jgi:SAM-dependent methyltransferase